MIPYSGERHLAEILSAYLDDELAPAARAEVEAHLERCGPCHEELEVVAWARAVVRALPVRACPPAVLGGLVTESGDWRAAASSYAPPARRVLWAAAAAAAAVVAVMLPREPDVAPVLPALVESHAARASVSGDPLSQLAPIAVPVKFGP